MKLILNGIEFDLDKETLTEQLKEGVENPSITISNDEFKIRSMEDESAFIENHKKDARKEGIEIAVKNARNTLNLDFQGKTVDNLIKAVQDKAIEDASIEPNEKVKTLTKDIETLQGTIERITGEKNEAEGKYVQFKNDHTIKSTLRGLIPDNITIPKDDMLTILNTRYKIELDENSNVTFADNNGLIKNDTTLNPLAPSEVITKFFDENKSYIKPVEGGAGGSDSGGGSGKKSIEEFNKEMTEKGIAINSQEFVNHMNAEISAGTLEV